MKAVISFPLQHRPHVGGLISTGQMPIKLQKSVGTENLTLSENMWVSSHHIRFQNFALFPSSGCGIRWFLPEITFLNPQEVRTQPWAGGEAGNRHLNGSKYQCEAEGWRFPVNPAHFGEGSVTALFLVNSIHLWSVRFTEEAPPLEIVKTNTWIDVLGLPLGTHGDQDNCWGRRRDRTQGLFEMEQVCLLWNEVFWCWLNRGWNPNARSRYAFLSWPCCIHRFFWDQNRTLSVN